MDASVEKTPTYPQDIEKKSVEDLLAFEISRGDSSQQRQGWTPWALYAALSALIWLFISEIEKGRVDMLQVGALWGVFVYGYYAIKSWNGFLNSENEGLPGSPRFTVLSRSMGGQRPLVFAVIVKQTVILAVFWHLFPLVSLVDKIFVGGYFIFDWLITAGAFVMSWLEFPIAIRWRRRGWGNFLVMGLIILWTAWSLIFVTNAYSQLFGFDSFSVLKVALLLFAVVEVLEYVIVSNSSQSMLPLLVSIRRELALGNITPQSARSHLDVTLLGMRVGDMMNSTVRDFITLMEKTEQKARGLSTQLEKIAVITELGVDQITDADVELFQTRYKVIEVTVVEIRTCLAEADKIVGRFKRRIELLRSINPDCAADIEALKAEMKRSVDRLKAALDGTSGCFTKISVSAKANPRLNVSGILSIQASFPTIKG